MLESFSVKDKVIIITGSLGFLGSTYVEGFSQGGANVVIVDLSSDLCTTKAEGIAKKYGTQPLGIGCDITNKEAVERMTRQVISKYSRIDVLINNAATQPENFFAPLEEYSVEDWNRVMGVNVTGMFLCSQAVIEEMKRGKKGSIINLTSIYGVVAPDQRTYQGAIHRERQINTPLVYSTSKAAVIGLTRYLASYLAKSGIRVNAVTPGGVYSGQNEIFVKNYSERCPMGRMANPEEVFNAVYFLASDASSYITGHNLIVDGGWTIW